jgi:hypothetical protein
MLMVAERRVRSSYGYPNRRLAHRAHRHLGQLAGGAYQAGLFRQRSPQSAEVADPPAIGDDLF